MIQKKIKNSVSALYQKLNEKYDMSKRQVMEVTFKQCVDGDDKPFISIEAVVVDTKTFDSDIVTMDVQC